MSKILFIGDPHIRHTHLSEGKALLDWIEIVVEEQKPDLIVNLGDTFHDHSVIRAEVMCTVSRHLDRLLENNIPIIMVLGNHDMYRPNSREYHALEVFQDKKNLIVADVVTVADGITYVPYLTSSESWPEIKTNLAVTHNTFLGADLGFKLSDSGFLLDQVEQNLVISGHIHKRQNLGSVIYPGTPMAISASEVDQPKGLMLLDLNGNKTKFIESPFPTWKSLTIGPGDLEDLKLDQFHKWIIKIVGPRAEVKAALESKALKTLKENAFLSIKTEFTDSIKSTKANISSSSMIGMVDKYLEIVYAGSIDRQVLKNTIETYMVKK